MGGPDWGALGSGKKSRLSSSYYGVEAAPKTAHTRPACLDSCIGDGTFLDTHGRDVI
jgi:hypothetical protein